MQFQRLRLSGFKSFVDATEFRIEPGLTGVVGPNGCGKSNLLEALRWVMGATSAKAMRGDGMDDVIFAGAETRPARNHAEVLLQIDNADKSAPAQFNAHAVLEVVRRIDRGAGSTYRVNGVETRARDVQLLFADASTGANSPALVRQGQISELISAKPANRRRVLEEAAGVSGLHSRRHEADLRLKAAESNLERLSEVVVDLEGRLARLKREARQAERYRRLSQEIRSQQEAALHARWREADAYRRDCASAFATAAAAVEAGETARREAGAACARLSEALPPLREEAALAQGLRQRLILERDRCERDLHQAQAETRRLESDLARLRADARREAQASEDALEALRRLGSEILDLESALASEPTRAAALEAGLREAERLRAAADQRLLALAAARAADEARRESEAQRRREAEGRRRAALGRSEECRARTARLEQALAAAEGAIAKLPPPQDLTGAEAALLGLEAGLQAAREAVESAEAERSRAQGEEAAARERERALREEEGGLASEREGLGRLTASLSEAGYPQVLTALHPAQGLEAALAAALGDEIEASLDPKAPRRFVGAEAAPPRWPDGATPLAPLIGAPPELAARLAFTALVASDDAPRLQRLAPPGARLVSREGGLWRWDGYVVSPEARRGAALRLAQSARLRVLEAALADIAPRRAAAGAALETTLTALRQSETRLKAARDALPSAERRLLSARADLEAARRRNAEATSRLEALEGERARLILEVREARAAAVSARAELDLADATLAGCAPEAAAVPAAELREAEGEAAAAREGEAKARAERDQEARAQTSRRSRKDALGREIGEWTRRGAGAEARLAELGREIETALSALAAARARPEELEGALQGLITGFTAAETRASDALDALALGEAEVQAAERALRGAEAAQATAREARAAADARLQAASEALEAQTEKVRRVLGEEPQVVGARLRAEAVATPRDAAAVEAHLERLEREREAFGGVNLAAEEEAREAGERLQSLLGERADLGGAVSRLRSAIEELNGEGRERLKAAFARINENFIALFETLFEGGRAELRLVESDDPLEAGLEIFACPPGKRLAAMSLMSGGEQALTAAALIFAVFLSNPSPVCVLDEVDAPLDDANVDRFCRLLDEMRRRTSTRFIVITHHPVTMSRVDRLYGVTMPDRGISQLVSVSLRQAEALAAE